MVVKSCGGSLIWERASIIPPMMILTRRSLSASGILLLDVGISEHRIALEVPDSQERRCRTGQAISVWFDVWNIK